MCIFFAAYWGSEGVYADSQEEAVYLYRFLKQGSHNPLLLVAAAVGDNADTQPHDSPI